MSDNRINENLVDPQTGERFCEIHETPPTQILFPVRLVAGYSGPMDREGEARAEHHSVLITCRDGQLFALLIHNEQTIDGLIKVLEEVRKRMYHVEGPHECEPE